MFCKSPVEYRTESDSIQEQRKQLNSAMEKPETLTERIVTRQSVDPFPYSRQQDRSGYEHCTNQTNPTGNFIEKYHLIKDSDHVSKTNLGKHFSRWNYLPNKCKNDVGRTSDGNGSSLLVLQRHRQQNLASKTEDG